MTATPGILAEVERECIAAAVTELNGDVMLAAKLLGIGKTTLYRKLHEYCIPLPGHNRGAARITPELAAKINEVAEFLTHCVGQTAPLLGRELLAELDKAAGRQS